MIRTYKAQINIAVTTDEVWNAIIQPEFTRDFLPEIDRDVLNLTLSKLATHKNPLNVMPAYMVHKKTISWDSQANTSIKCARQDLTVEIDSIDIDLRDYGNSTSVSIEVQYKTAFSAMFLQSERAVRGVFDLKLDVLKKDLELTKQDSHPMQVA